MQKGEAVLWRSGRGEKELTFIELLLCRRRSTPLHVVAEKQSSGATGPRGCILALSLADCVWPPASDFKASQL